MVGRYARCQIGLRFMVIFRAIPGSFAVLDEAGLWAMYRQFKRYDTGWQIFPNGKIR